MKLRLGKCFRCGIEKERSGSYCIACTKTYQQEWYLTKRGPKAAKDAYLPALRGRLRHILKCRTGKYSRKDIELEWAWNKLGTNDYRCEITGAVFDLAARSPQALSIDRIDNNKGYAPDNVRFVCWWVNASVGTWGVSRLKELIEEWQKSTNYQQIIKDSST